MPNLNYSELNSLRELIMGHQTMVAKFSTYAPLCQDPQIQQMFQKAGNDAQQAVTKLLQAL